MFTLSLTEDRSWMVFLFLVRDTTCVNRQHGFRNARLTSPEVANADGGRFSQRHQTRARNRIDPRARHTRTASTVPAAAGGAGG
jgi:hypothetical protein